MAFRLGLRKIGEFEDPLVDEQFQTIVDHSLPFLGLRSSDPTTTGWDARHICFWLKTTSTVASGVVSCVMKCWNGTAVKTVTWS